MKIAIRFGHCVGGDYGAVGLLDEFKEIREYGPYAVSTLLRHGVEVVNVTPETCVNPYNGVFQGIDKANAENVDLFISLHINSFTSPDGNGATVLHAQGSVEGSMLAQSILNKISSLGFANRGLMPKTGFWELDSTDAWAVIVEPFFVSSPKDVDLYRKIGAEKLGEAIAKGILEYAGVEFVPTQNLDMVPRAELDKANARIAEVTNMYYTLLGKVINLGKEFA